MQLLKMHFTKLNAANKTCSNQPLTEILKKNMTAVSATNPPKISIITPSLNRVEMLKAAVQSVVSQGYPNYEHIVIDGGSTDDTLEFVKTQPQIKFICEPDRGMYDALNKGLALATGEVIGLLNTDDLYAEGIFSPVMKMFMDPGVLVVAGRAEVFFDNLTDRRKIDLHYSPEEQSLLESTLISGNYFNAWFFRKSVFDMVGCFDPAYKIAGDRDFMLRIALKDMPFKTIDKLAYLYRGHASSLSFGNSDDKQHLITNELIRMTAHYLKHYQLRFAEKRLIARVHTQTSLAIARWHEHSGDMAAYLSVIMDCVRHDPYSIFRVLRHLIRSLLNQFGRLIRK
jgi:glycosyltransferase involved in cell wall biosynthesis